MDKDREVKELAKYLSGETDTPEPTKDTHEDMNVVSSKEVEEELQSSIASLEEKKRKIQDDITDLHMDIVSLEEKEKGLKSSILALEEQKNKSLPSEAFASEKGRGETPTGSDEELEEITDFFNDEEKEAKVDFEDTEEIDQAPHEEHNDDEELEEITDFFNDEEKEAKVDFEDAEEIDPKKNKTEKPSSLLKKVLYILISVILITALGIFGYVFVKKNGKSVEAKNQVVLVKKANIESQKPRIVVGNRVDENKIESGNKNIKEEKSYKKTVKIQNAVETKETSFKNIPLPTNGNTLVVAPPVIAASPASISAPREKSPIEKELLGDSDVQKDISFVCRLKAQYKSGEYIYYVKSKDGYVPNSNDSIVEIEEKNIVYNYSPESQFIKVENGKYLKSKIFTQCVAVKTTK